MKSSGVNYYKLLAIPSCATFDEIRTAYRKKILSCHIDKNSTKSSECYETIEAYRILSNRQLRSKYDIELHTASSAKISDSQLWEKYKNDYEEIAPNAKILDEIRKKHEENFLVDSFKPAGYICYDVEDLPSKNILKYLKEWETECEKGDSFIFAQSNENSTDFFSCYSKLFSNVLKVRSEEDFETEFSCEICGRNFISSSHHNSLVIEPYISYWDTKSAQNKDENIFNFDELLKTECSEIYASCFGSIFEKNSNWIWDHPAWANLDIFYESLYEIIDEIPRRDKFDDIVEHVEYIREFVADPISDLICWLIYSHENDNAGSMLIRRAKELFDKNQVEELIYFGLILGQFFGLTEGHWEGLREDSLFENEAQIAVYFTKISEIFCSESIESIWIHLGVRIRNNLQLAHQCFIFSGAYFSKVADELTAADEHKLALYYHVLSNEPRKLYKKMRNFGRVPSRNENIYEKGWRLLTLKSILKVLRKEADSNFEIYAECIKNEAEEGSEFSYSETESEVLETSFDDSSELSTSEFLSSDDIWSSNNLKNLKKEAKNLKLTSTRPQHQPENKNQTVPKLTEEEKLKYLNEVVKITAFLLKDPINFYKELLNEFPQFFTKLPKVHLVLINKLMGEKVQSFKNLHLIISALHFVSPGNELGEIFKFLDLNMCKITQNNLSSCISSCDFDTLTETLLNLTKRNASAAQIIYETLQNREKNEENFGNHLKAMKSLIRATILKIDKNWIGASNEFQNALFNTPELLGRISPCISKLTQDFELHDGILKNVDSKLIELKNEIEGNKYLEIEKTENSLVLTSTTPQNESYYKDLTEKIQLSDNLDNKNKEENNENSNPPPIETNTPLVTLEKCQKAIEEKNCQSSSFTTGALSYLDLCRALPTNMQSGPLVMAASYFLKAMSECECDKNKKFELDDEILENIKDFLSWACADKNIEKNASISEPIDENPKNCECDKNTCDSLNEENCENSQLISSILLENEIKLKDDLPLEENSSIKSTDVELEKNITKEENFYFCSSCAKLSKLFSLRKAIFKIATQLIELSENSYSNITQTSLTHKQMFSIILMANQTLSQFLKKNSQEDVNFITITEENLAQKFLWNILNFSQIDPLLNIPTLSCSDLTYVEKVKSHFLKQFCGERVKNPIVLKSREKFTKVSVGAAAHALLLESYFTKNVDNLDFELNRIRTLKAFLNEKNWEFEHMKNFIRAPFLSLDELGFVDSEIIELNLKTGDKKEGSFQNYGGIHGFELDFEKKEIFLLLSKGNLFSSQDILEIFKMNNACNIIFEIRDILPSLKLHPCKEVIAEPQKLLKSNLCKTVLRFFEIFTNFGTGVEISYEPPFEFKKIEDGKFGSMPEHLQYLLRSILSRTKNKTLANNFDFDFNFRDFCEEEEENSSNLNYIYKLGGGELSIESKSINDLEENPKNPEVSFCTDFSRYFSELGRSYAELIRLKEISKILIIATKLKEKLKFLEQTNEKDAFPFKNYIEILKSEKILIFDVEESKNSDSFDNKSCNWIPSLNCQNILPNLNINTKFTLSSQTTYGPVDLGSSVIKIPLHEIIQNCTGKNIENCIYVTVTLPTPRVKDENFSEKVSKSLSAQNLSWSPNNIQISNDEKSNSLENMDGNESSLSESENNGKIFDDDDEESDKNFSTDSSINDKIDKTLVIDEISENDTSETSDWSEDDEIKIVKNPNICEKTINESEKLVTVSSFYLKSAYESSSEDDDEKVEIIQTVLENSDKFENLKLIRLKSFKDFELEKANYSEVSGNESDVENSEYDSLN